MLFIAAIVAAVPPPALSAPQARAAVRIERPQRAGADQWERAPRESKREAIIRDEQGRRLLLRTIEQQ